MPRTRINRIPVIDLFAGPGGLGEGFSSYPKGGRPAFQIALSIEKDEDAHRTLLTRAFYRQFAPSKVPEAYYRHLRGELSQEEMFDFDDQCRAAAKAARDEALQVTLGDAPDAPPDPQKRERVRKLILERVGSNKLWVLIGGPPCQAYSIAGRSRMTGVTRRDKESERSYRARKRAREKAFSGDHRHLLYREYLAIIADHWPPLFVMENVKGLLSSKHGGEFIFPMIRRDLSDPNKALGIRGKGMTYRICSLAVPSLVPGEGLAKEDFLLRAEEHGVSQRRHRVILLGVREDLDAGTIPVLQKSPPPSLADLLGDLPVIVPGVTRRGLPKKVTALGRRRDVDLGWVLDQIERSTWLKDLPKSAPAKEAEVYSKIQKEIRKTLNRLKKTWSGMGRGEEFITRRSNLQISGSLAGWLEDPRLGGVCNHSCRSHMASDLHRYLFISSFGKVKGKSPKLEEFPKQLLPDHSNVKGENSDLKKFADRFRVQLGGGTAATITCHIGKDGHANIHYDPSQIRSLTVREAARIQTFPDNYFFEGNRTSQYQQVGNAVPPYLAHQIAEVVYGILSKLR